MSAYVDWLLGDEAPWEKVNRNFRATGQVRTFAEREVAHASLAIGYGGGPFDANTVADGTVTGLTDNTTNYVVVHRTTRAVTSATATTNWNNTTTYGRMARAVFAAGVLTYHDERFSVGGIFDHGAAAAGDALTANSLAQFAATTSAELRGVLSDETGTGSAVFATSPTLVTPALGTPSALVLTNATGLPVAGGGTGVATLTAYAPVFGGTTGSGAVQSGTVGTATHVLTSNGPGALPTFQAPAASGSVATDAIWDVAGDLVYGAGSNTGARLAIGTARQSLRVNSGATAPEWVSDTQCIAVACSDETTALTTGTAKVTFRMPYAFTLTDVRASVTTAPTGGTLLTVDVNEGGTTILSTKLTFDASEKTTTTAATPRVISDATLADDAEMTIDIDAVGSTIAGAGLKVYLIGYRT